MRSLRKIIRRNRELKQNRDTMRQIQQQLSEHLKQPIKLKAAPGKSGQDQIYSVRQGRKTTAMVRVENPNKEIFQGPPKWNFRTALNLSDRIEKEWYAYEKLSVLNLSPKPLWRSETAMAGSMIHAQRASRRFIHCKKDFWLLAEKIFAAVEQMHDCGITHMDLNLGNILIHPKTNAVTLIDFEFGPAKGILPNQQRAFDYLCLLNEFVRERRGGKIMLKAPERMAELLSKYVREEDRSADLSHIVPQLKRLPQQRDLCNALRAIFPNLEARR
jgi:thiamine kinase-like enzyme